MRSHSLVSTPSLVVRGSPLRARPAVARASWAIAWTLAACGLAACASDPPAGPTPPSDTVTWYEHVAPIVYRECVSCHRDGAVAPFSLERYETAEALAGAMAAATAARRMPPMPVSNAGDCNTFTNARWLSDDEIATIAAWAEAGAPAGDPALGPSLPAPQPGLDTANVVLDTGVDYLPSATRTDDYRCFVVDPGLDEMAFLTAYEVVPGEPRVVHHVIVYEPSDEAAVADVRAADDADPEVGYPCFGGIGASSEPRVLWAPGVGVTRMPSGTGVGIAPGRPLVVQIHYNTIDGALADLARVRLELAPSVARRGGYVPIADVRMRVAPRMEHVETEASFPARGVSALVYGVLPHMHTLGRTLTVTADTADGEQCLVHVDRWNFAWQGAWWYETPLTLREIDSITIRCGYDTRERTDMVTWGEGTMDEMCLNYLYVAM